ncbi:MAG: hypothetical protein JSW25_00605 [Thermoplasmata archaeon]|nr:MAG: hypothetical protein JSW25_00605 [Thermoplasmata archaeon]
MSLWTCPKCGRAFTRRGQPHSCGEYSEEGFLEGASDRALVLYGRFKEELESVAPFRLAPAKTRMGFQTRRIFATIKTLGKGHISGHLVLNGEFPGPKFNSVTRVCDTDVAHNFRIESEDFFDDEFRKWLVKAYEYGG